MGKKTQIAELWTKPLRLLQEVTRRLRQASRTPHFLPACFSFGFACVLFRFVLITIQTNHPWIQRNASRFQRPRKAPALPWKRKSIPRSLCRYQGDGLVSPAPVPRASSLAFWKPASVWEEVLALEPGFVHQTHITAARWEIWESVEFLYICEMPDLGK